jgi:16S rRNA (uracil1498-N3)-methyltransferase
VLPRFYAPEADPAAASVRLPDDEAAHLTRVLRLTAGARVRVFDGRGHEWLASVIDATRAAVRVELLETAVAAPESRVTLALALAWLKGDKMDDVVRDAVMLGVTRIVPLLTKYTEARPAAAASRGRRAERWHRVAVASAKQCGRAVVPRVEEPVRFVDYLDGATGALRVMFVEPSAGVGAAVDVQTLPRADAVEVCTGPEGGWSPDETAAAARAGCTLVTLRAGTLRADAVPLVALTAVRALWDDL